MNTQWYKEIEGRMVFFHEPLIIGDKQIFNPTDEQMTAEGWQVYVPPQPEPHVPTYSERVNALIRERYSDNDEWMIIRRHLANLDDQMFTAAFNDYNTYVEECLVKARETTTNAGA